MQPEQQTQTPQTSSNIPDYLGMEPVAGIETAKRKRKKVFRLIAVAFVLVIVVFAGATGTYLFVQQNSPEVRFYQALENSMQVSYVSREYTIKTKKSDTITSNGIVADTDFSDPKSPKSHLKHELSQTQNSSERSFIGEDIILNDREYVSLAKSITPNTLPGNTELNQWYTYSAYAIGRESVEYSPDDESRLTLNSAQGIIVMGNFSSAHRAQLMDTIQKHKVYLVLDGEPEDKNNKQLTRYTIQINHSALNELNKEVADLLDIGRVHLISTSQSNDEEFKLWVDNTTGRFVKMTYTVGKNKDSLRSEKDIEFSYPATLSITKPPNVIDVSR